MAPYDQPVYTYSDTTPHKRVVTDIIENLDPFDAPAVMALGGLDGASSKFNFVNEPSTKVEWLEDTLIAIADTMAATAASDATTLTVTDGSLFQKGHVILIGSEQLWVSSVATNTLTVTRAFGGTAATISSTASITIIGMARLEGAESDSIGLTDITSNSNYTQILHKELKVSRSQEQISQYGIASTMSYQMDKAIPELMRLLERHFYYNTVAKAGSATTPRAMGGYRAFVTNNLADGSSLTQAKVEDAVQAIWEDGGTGPWFAFCSGDRYQAIKNFYDSSNYLRIDRTETTVGMVVNQIHTPFGDVNLVLDRWATSTEIALIDPEHAGFKTYYPFTWEPLAKTGDYERAEIVGEFTFCLRLDKAHGILTNCS